jgi:gluconolactonase
VHGVYRLAPDGGLSLVVDDFALPNGLAFLAGRVDPLRRRFCAQAYPGIHGTARCARLSDSRILLDMASSDPGVPDGLKVDVQGNVFCHGARRRVGVSREWRYCWGASSVRNCRRTMGVG